MTATISSSRSVFHAIEAGSPDPILGITEAFQADPNPKKVNLGVGAYQNDSGKVPILRSVREAEERWLAKEDSKAYLPIPGPESFLKAVQSLLFGADSPLPASGKLVTAQALGGTGALKIGADFLRRFFPDSGVWISQPTWENHRSLFEQAGFCVRAYPYYNPETHGLDDLGMLDTLRGLPPRSIVVLHVCCHNPTGVDMTPAQWAAVREAVQNADLIPFLDFAYQGFADGIEEDAAVIRDFAHAGIPCLVANSFSKSFSLYRERVGALTVVTADREEAARVQSQLKRVIRGNYSSPPSHGGSTAMTVLTDPELRAIWAEELETMRLRIRRMRVEFAEGLRARGAARDFRFVLGQRGMFSYSGLPIDAVRRLRTEYSIYALESGRICIAALNDHNLSYVCDSITAVL